MKRIPRKMPKEHKNLDVMKPLIYEKLGSVDDPCFSNYSAKDEACKRCGDSEICAAVSSSKLITDSLKIEETQPFKDIDEGKLVDDQNLQIAKRMINISNHAEGWRSIKKLIPELTDTFNLTEKDEPVLIQRCIKAAKNNSKLKLNKKLTKYQLK